MRIQKSIAVLMIVGGVVVGPVTFGADNPRSYQCASKTTAPSFGDGGYGALLCPGGILQFNLNSKDSYQQDNTTNFSAPSGGSIDVTVTAGGNAVLLPGPPASQTRHCSTSNCLVQYSAPNAAGGYIQYKNNSSNIVVVAPVGANTFDVSCTNPNAWAMVSAGYGVCAAPNSEKQYVCQPGYEINDGVGITGYSAGVTVKYKNQVYCISKSGSISTQNCAACMQSPL